MTKLDHRRNNDREQSKQSLFVNAWDVPQDRVFEPPADGPVAEPPVIKRRVLDQVIGTPDQPPAPFEDADVRYTNSNVCEHRPKCGNLERERYRLPTIPKHVGVRARELPETEIERLRVNEYINHLYDCSQLDTCETCQRTSPGYPQ